MSGVRLHVQYGKLYTILSTNKQSYCCDIAATTVTTTTTTVTTTVTNTNTVTTTTITNVTTTTTRTITTTGIAITTATFTTTATTTTTSDANAASTNHVCLEQGSANFNSHLGLFPHKKKKKFNCMLCIKIAKYKK